MISIGFGKYIKTALSILIISLLSGAICGQETPEVFDGKNWEAPYALPVPKEWGVERFPIPIGFAPQIPYSGVEDIRFMPGWGNAKSDAYWSYAFLWYLDGDVKMDVKTIVRNLEAYYTGLIAANGGKTPGEKPAQAEASFKEVHKSEGDMKTFTGTIRMVDYMGKRPIVLNGKVHVRSCAGENKTFIFFELSPQPFSHVVWSALDQLWLDFQCTKN